MENNVLLEKSLAFAARIVKVYRYLSEQQHETVLSQQLLRSGTSIGANANEAVYAVSKADFISKLHISLKETAETEYWLRLLTLSQYLTAAESRTRKSVRKCTTTSLAAQCRCLWQSTLQPVM